MVASKSKAKKSPKSKLALAIIVALKTKKPIKSNGRKKYKG